jgi:hypothetical protein
MQTNITGNLVAEITELIANAKEEHNLKLGQEVTVMHHGDVQWWKTKGTIVALRRDPQNNPIYMIENEHGYQILVHEGLLMV